MRIRRQWKHLLSKTVCLRWVFMSGFYTLLSLASSLLIFNLPRSCLTTSLYVFLGSSLTKLSPTTNFQYIQDQNSLLFFPKFLQFFPFFKCFKKAHWNKEKESLSSFFTDSENDEIGEIDESYFEICFTLELHMVKELVQKMIHKHNEMSAFILCQILCKLLDFYCKVYLLCRN